MADTDTAGSPTAVNGGSIYETTKANASAAFNTVTSGPVAQNVRVESVKTTSELSNLAAARKTPPNPAATGQPLTHYHSFFHELLSWNNPRASAIALVSIVSFIFAARYLDVTRYFFKLTWMALGVTVAAESAGKFLLNKGLATQFRPRRYYTVSREMIDGAVGDVTELLNFVVIEAQRILFVENVSASLAAAIFAFLSYHLTKIVPYWGLAVIGTLVAFLAPLVYINNKELIDHHLKNAVDVVEAQTSQVRNVAQKQAEQVTAIGKQYAGDYTGKVQEMLRGRGGPPKNDIYEKVPEFPEVPAHESTKRAVDVDAPYVPDELDIHDHGEEAPLIS